MPAALCGAGERASKAQAGEKTGVAVCGGAVEPVASKLCRRKVLCRRICTGPGTVEGLLFIHCMITRANRTIVRTVGLHTFVLRTAKAVGP